MGCQLCKDTDPHEIELDGNDQPQQKKLKSAKKPRALKSSPPKAFIPSKHVSTVQAGFTIDSIAQISSDSFAVGLSNGVIAVYSISSSAATQQYTLSGHTGTVKALIKLKDGRLCSGGGDSSMKIWRLYERRLDVDITPHTNWVNALLQPKDSDIVITGSSDNTIKVIDLLNSNQVSHTFNVEKNVDCLCDLGENKFASNSGDGIVIWDLNTKTKLHEFEGAFSTVVSMVYLESGQLITGAVNGNIKIYDINTKQRVATLKDSGNLGMIAMVSKNVLAVTIGNGIKLWNINEKTEIRTLTGHTEDVKVALLMNEEKFLVSGGNDKAIKLWQ